MDNTRHKKILVTGGGGFIPSHLVRRLVNEGNEVAITAKYNSVIDNIRLTDVWDEIHVIEADLRNSDALLQVAQYQPDVIYHLAAYNHVGDSFFNISEALDSNSKGSANLLRAYDKFDRFIYMSTSEVYGYQESVPFIETMTPSPISPYSIGKYSGELFADMMMNHFGLPITILRPFNTFGPYQSVKAIIPELIIRCLRGLPIRLTEGVQTREFNYVNNIVDALVLAGEKEEAIGNVINVGAGEEISIRELLIRIHELTNSSSDLQIGALPYRPTEIWRMRADNSRALSCLGWQPVVSLEDGLRHTIEWFKHYIAEFNDRNSRLHALASCSFLPKH